MRRPWFSPTSAPAASVPVTFTSLNVRLPTTPSNPILPNNPEYARPAVKRLLRVCPLPSNVALKSRANS